MARESPRSFDSDSSLRPSSSSPCRVIDPVIFAVAGCRPITASEVTDLPEPDSPTMASDSPAASSNDSPRTAWTGPASLGNVTCRSCTFSTVPEVVRRTFAPPEVSALIGRNPPTRSSDRGHRATRHPPR